MDKAFRKETPTFTPTKLSFKCEDGTDRNPIGPLYYVNGTRYEPVYVDTMIPSALTNGKFSPAWISLRQAKQIAQAENLPLETF